MFLIASFSGRSADFVQFIFYPEISPKQPKIVKMLGMDCNG